MFYVQMITDSFWSIATALVPLIVPVLAVILLFQIIRGLLIK